MAELILHHYWESPYAEKIRRLMGMKSLSWRSVIIPMVMPKPDLTALTGGYRKTPVLQIGADVYCDTDLIARDDRPPASRAAALPGRLRAALPDARRVAAGALLAGRARGRHARAHLPAGIPRGPLDHGRGRPLARAARRRRARAARAAPREARPPRHAPPRARFVLGDRPSLADLSLFHPVYCMKIIPATAEDLEPYAPPAGVAGAHRGLRPRDLHRDAGRRGRRGGAPGDAGDGAGARPGRAERPTAGRPRRGRARELRPGPGRRASWSRRRRTRSRSRGATRGQGTWSSTCRASTTG